MRWQRLQARRWLQVRRMMNTQRDNTHLRLVRICSVQIRDLRSWAF